MIITIINGNQITFYCYNVIVMQERHISEGRKFDSGTFHNKSNIDEGGQRELLEFSTFLNVGIHLPLPLYNC